MFKPIPAWAVLLPNGTVVLHTVAKEADTARALLLNGDSTAGDWIVLEKLGHRVVPIMIGPDQQEPQRPT